MSYTIQCPNKLQNDEKTHTILGDLTIRTVQNGNFSMANQKLNEIRKQFTFSFHFLFPREAMVQATIETLVL